MRRKFERKRFMYDIKIMDESELSIPMVGAANGVRELTFNEITDVSGGFVCGGLCIAGAFVAGVAVGGAAVYVAHRLLN